METAAGSLPLSIEEKRNWVADTALHFISIGWLVQEDGRGIVISQPNQLPDRQNLSGNVE